MNITTNSHEELTFIKVIQVLCASGTGKEDYGLDHCKVTNGKTRLEDVAQILNGLEDHNSPRRLWNKQSLNRVIQRLRKRPRSVSS